MKKQLFLFVALLTVAVLAGPASEGSGWRWYTPGTPCGCQGGILEVWATNNCNPVPPPVFPPAWVDYGEHRHGSTPDIWNGQEVNDMVFVWDCGEPGSGCTCATVFTKLAVPRWKHHEWILADLDKWIDRHVEVMTVPPMFGGPAPAVYVVVDLAHWDDSSFVLGQSYTFLDGVCDELPGLLVGTSPIGFDPNAPKDGNPFFTTAPFNGAMFPHGEIALVGKEAADEDEDSDSLMRELSLPQPPAPFNNKSCCPQSEE
jgi:hypothetical protein